MPAVAAQHEPAAVARLLSDDALLDAGGLGRALAAARHRFVRDWYIARFVYGVVAKGYTPFGFVTSLK